MNGKRLLPAVFTLPALLIASSIANAIDTPPAERPNIVLILSDDLAWSDLACYGHPFHETPHLDALAAEGMRFTDAYSPAPICSASRCSILTGKNVARVGFEFVTKDKPGRQQIEGETLLEAPPLTLNLPLEEITIAEALNPAGYETTFAGKWHVSQHHKGYLGWSPTHGPKQQGFTTTIDDFGAHPYARKKGEMLNVVAGTFPADSLTELAVDFVKGQHSKPFFLMLSHYFVHTPVKPGCQWLIDKYEGIVPNDSPARTNRVRYAAFVEMLDHYVGEMLDGIEDAGLTDNTLIIFTSDNGGHPEYAANSPLRGSKWNLYEGGIRVPMIARWPGKVKAGSICSEPVIGYDFLPTFTELASVDAPDDIDGHSLVPLLTGKPSLPERNLLWHFPYYHPERGYRDAPTEIGIDDFFTSQTHPQSALRNGQHKLILDYETKRARLYDLVSDPGEQRDLAEKNPVLRLRLETFLNQALKESGARLPGRRPLTPSP